MRLGDSFPHKLSIRLSDRQFIFIQEICEQADLSPSEFIRMMLDSNMAKIRGAVYENKEAD